MSAAHTPGPWACMGDDEADGIPYLVIETDKPTGPDLRPICHVQPSYDDANDSFAILAEDEANARLIAAAPDLLEAAEQFERVAEYELRKKRRENPEDDEGIRLRELNLSLIRATIARATGAA